MKNINQKILFILPIFIFIGMLAYVSPSHAGVLGTIKDLGEKGWDAATTIGSAVIDMASGAGNAADAAGSVVASALGLLPAHDCPAPILDSTERPCMFCQMFRIIYMACAGIAQNTYNFFHSDIGTLILVFMGVSLALIVLKNVVVMGARDPGSIANELFSKGFICAAIYFIVAKDYFNMLNLTINSVIVDGLKFVEEINTYQEAGIGKFSTNLAGSYKFMGASEGAAFNANIGNLLLQGIYHIERKINVLFQYGNYAMCLGTGPERIFKLLPNPIFLIDGLMLYIGGLLFLIGYPWVLADALLQMGIAMALLPFTLAGYAFNGTKNYLNKTFQWILHALFVFIFMGILIKCVLDFVSNIIIDLFGNYFEAHEFFTDPEKGIAFYGINMLKIMFILCIGWVYMPLTRDLASKFSKGSALTAATATGKAVTNAAEQNLMRAGNWAGNATIDATKHAARYVSRQTGRKPIMALTSMFGRDDGHGNKTLPRFLTGGVKFTVENVGGGQKVLRREFTSISGRKHVMLADKYTTIKEEYSANGRLIRREATFKKEFIRDHLFDKNGQINKGNFKALLDSPLGKNPAYRQAIMEQVAIEKLKKCNKNLGRYFKSRRVVFDHAHPERIQIIQVDHNDRETHVTFDANMDTGQSAISYSSRFKHREFSVRKKSEVDFYFNNGVVEISTEARRKANGKLREEVTKFRYSSAAQKGHDSILVNGGNQIVDSHGRIAPDLLPTRGGNANPLNLTFGMDSILGGTYVAGHTVSDFLVQNVLREGTVRHTNKFTTNISHHFI